MKKLILRVFAALSISIYPIETTAHQHPMKVYIQQDHLDVIIRPECWKEKIDSTARIVQYNVVNETFAHNYTSECVEEHPLSIKSSRSFFCDHDVFEAISNGHLNIYEHDFQSIPLMFLKNKIDVDLATMAAHANYKQQACAQKEDVYKGHFLKDKLFFLSRFNCIFQPEHLSEEEEGHIPEPISQSTEYLILLFFASCKNVDHRSWTDWIQEFFLGTHANEYLIQIQPCHHCTDWYGEFVHRMQSLQHAFNTGDHSAEL